MRCALGYHGFSQYIKEISLLSKFCIQCLYPFPQICIHVICFESFNAIMSLVVFHTLVKGELLGFFLPYTHLISLYGVRYKLYRFQVFFVVLQSFQLYIYFNSLNLMHTRLKLLYSIVYIRTTICIIASHWNLIWFNQVYLTSRWVLP